LDSNQVTSIIHHYGANTRRELGLITRAQITEEILTGKTVRKGRNISRLQGNKISLLLTEIGTYLRGEFQWDADGDVHWETAIPLLTPRTPCVHTLDRGAIEGGPKSPFWRQCPNARRARSYFFYSLINPKKKEIA